jgi:hypothetical protein
MSSEKNKINRHIGGDKRENLIASNSNYEETFE